MLTIPISTEVAPRFCGNCGHEVSPQASFCRECGQTMVQFQPEHSPAWLAQPQAGAARKVGSRRLLILGVTALVLSAIAVSVVFVAHPSGGHGLGTRPIVTPTTTSVAPAPSASPSSAAPTATAASEQQAAESLASLLAQSVADRAAVDHAYNDVQSCGPDLSADAQVFENTAASRQKLATSWPIFPPVRAPPADAAGTIRRLAGVGRRGQRLRTVGPGRRGRDLHAG